MNLFNNINKIYNKLYINYIISLSDLITYFVIANIFFDLTEGVSNLIMTPVHLILLYIMGCTLYNNIKNK